MELPSLTSKLIDKLNRPKTDIDRDRAALHFLDWLGCSILGKNSHSGEIISKYVSTKEKGSSTVIGGFSSSAEAAAFANGAFGNVLEMDDIHRTSILHPGPVIIPAAFASAQSKKVSSKLFLDSIICGYEIMISIGQSVGPSHYSFFHNTATCGPFGSAAACAIIYGLNHSQFISALGNAGSLTGGLWQLRNEDVMTKQLHNAHASRSGLIAALLARDGFTGPAKILEGSLGFFAAMCPDANPDKISFDKNKNWKIFDTSFKPWAACRHAHSTIDASLKIKEKVSLEEIEKILVYTYEDSIKFCDNVNPKTQLQAKFSLQHSVATSIIDGPPTLKSFEKENFERNDIKQLRNKIYIESSDYHNSLYPNHYGATIKVNKIDGSCIEVVEKDALGDPDKPINSEQVISKARSLMLESGLSEHKINNIVNQSLSLSKGGTLDHLGETLG